MRGAVSLAAALALPLATDAGAPFPHRDLIIFLTFCVILGTLVLQGLTLPAVIRVLGIERDTSEEAEDAQGEDPCGRGGARTPRRARGRGLGPRRDRRAYARALQLRRNRFSSRFRRRNRTVRSRSSRRPYQRLRRELLDAERAAVTELGRSGVISGDVVSGVRRDLDLEDARLDDLAGTTGGRCAAPSSRACGR
jgi:CPA1 family monovalent cation:H+ antiporter